MQGTDTTNEYAASREIEPCLYVRVRLFGTPLGSGQLSQCPFARYCLVVTGLVLSRPREGTTGRARVMNASSHVLEVICIL